MKHIFFLLLFLPVLAYAQFPASPNKIRLGNQTTADGLVVRTAASPSWTPSTINNAWLAFDTVAVKLYYYDAGAWNEYTGGSVNIGNTDLTLTGNRRLNTGGYTFWIQDGTGAEVPYIYIGGDQVSFAASTTTSVYLDSSEQRAAIIAGAVIDIDADSIRIIGTQPNDNTLNRLLALDTITNRLHYVDKASIPDTDTNFATSNLTFSGNRVHNLSTRTLTIADGGTYPTYQQSSATDGIGLYSTAADYLALSPALVNLGSTGIMGLAATDTLTITAPRIRLNGADTRIQQIPNDNALNRLAAIDSLTGRLYYVDKSSIETGNLANANLTQTEEDRIYTLPYPGAGLQFHNTANSKIQALFSHSQGSEPHTGQYYFSAKDTALTKESIIQGYGKMLKLQSDSLIFRQPPNSNSLNRLLAIDSLTGEMHYVDKASIAGGGGTVTGTGTTNTIAKWTSSTALGNSLFTDDGTNSVATGTASFRLPNGTTAQRPGSPLAGMMRYNTSNGNLDFYGASAWENPVRSDNGTGLGTANYVSFYNANGRLSAGNAGLRFFESPYPYMQYGRSVTLTDNTIFYWLNGNSDSRLITNSSGATRSNETGAWRVVAEAAGAHTYNNFNVATITGLTSSGIPSGGSYRGIRAEMALTNTAGATDVIGVETRATNSSAGTTTALNAVLAVIASNAGGTTTTARGVYVGNITNSASSTMTNTYGVHVGDITAGTQTNTARSFYAEDGNAINVFNGSTMLGTTTAPSRTLHVTGEARITDLTTDTPTRIVGADADGDIGAITVGSGLTLSSSTLSATYSLSQITVSGGSTSLSLGAAERPDNDTGGSVTTSTVGSDFSVTGSTLNYTGGNGALLRLSGVASFTIDTDLDMHVRFYKEGAEVAGTEMRVTCIADNYVTVALPDITVSANTNDTFEIRVEPVSSGTIGLTSHRYNFLIERIY